MLYNSIEDQAVIEGFLKAGLMAIIPVYSEAGKTLVITEEGEQYFKVCATWMIEKLAAFYNINLTSLRRECGKLLELANHTPIPMGENLILMPVKVRHMVEPGEVTIGYVNAVHIKKIKKIKGKVGGDQETAAEIIFKNGSALPTLNRSSTLCQRLHDCQAICDSFTSRWNLIQTNCGIKSESILGVATKRDCVILERLAVQYNLHNKS